jgi:hypothetical protein
MGAYVEHVGHGLESSVGVVGEPSGLGHRKLVEHEERVQAPELVPGATRDIRRSANDTRRIQSARGSWDVLYLPMLRLTVAPCPSDWASESSFLTTALGFSNGAVGADEDMVMAGSKNTALTTRIRRRRRTRTRSGVVLPLLLELVFLEGAAGKRRRLLLSLVRRASAV